MSTFTLPSRTISQAVAEALHRHSDHVFGLMGNGNAHLIEGFGRIGMRMTEVRHEAGAVAAADAYTRVSGKIAVATTPYGAGFSNTVTALAEAAQARTPMLVVVGDEPTTGPRPWGIDQAQLAAAVGVRTIVIDPQRLDAQVDAAVSEAWATRQPVVIAIPYDLAAAPAEGADATAGAPAQNIGADRPAPTTPTVSASELANAAKLLVSAQRPVIIAGAGAWYADAGAELSEIADLLGAPTASTARARGIFARPRYDLGITGGFGQEAAMGVIAEADVVLVIGASLNQFTMRFGELLGEGSTLIRVDTAEVAPPQTVHPVTQHLLCGDAKVTAAALRDLIAEHTGSEARSRGWRESLLGLEPDGALRRLDDGLSEHPDGVCADGLLDPRSVAARIAEYLPADRHVTSDGGHFIGWANMFWPVASPGRMIMVGTAYQTIGLGIHTIAGVAAAAPQSTVVLSTGDGGGLMALADLETAIRTTSSCVIVVWNDGAYSAEVHLYGTMGLDQAPMLIPYANFAGMATALGATGVRVDRLEDLDRLREWVADGATGTIVLDCRVSRSVVAPYQREVQRANGLTPE